MENRKFILKSNTNVLEIISRLNEIKSKDINVLHCYGRLTKISNKIINAAKNCTLVSAEYSKVQYKNIKSQVFNILILEDINLQLNLLPLLIERVPRYGVIILITDKNETNDYFKKRFLYLIDNMNTKAEIDDLFNDVSLGIIVREKKQNCKDLNHLCASKGQEKLLEKLVNSLKTSNIAESVCMIEGPSGCGKRTAMSYGVANAIKLGLTNIDVIGPDSAELEMFYSQVRDGLKELGYTDQSMSRIYDKNIDCNQLKVEVSGSNLCQNIRFFQFEGLVTKSYNDLLCILEAGQIDNMILQRIVNMSLKNIWLTVNSNGYQSCGCGVLNELEKSMRKLCGVTATLESGQMKTVKSKGFIGRQMNGSKSYGHFLVTTPILYNEDDEIEMCINNIYGLANSMDRMGKLMPDDKRINFTGNILAAPDQCELILVNKTTLFSCNGASEFMLSQFMDIYNSNKRKRCNTGLIQLINNPNHNLMLLVQPSKTDKSVPQIYCLAHISIQEDVEKLLKLNIFPNMEINAAKIEMIITKNKFLKQGYGRAMIEKLNNYFSTQSMQPDSNNNKHLLLNHNKLSIGSNVDELPKLLMNIFTDLPAPSFHTMLTYVQLPIDNSFGFWKKLKYFPAAILDKPVNSEIIDCVMIRQCCKSNISDIDFGHLAFYNLSCQAKHIFSTDTNCTINTQNLTDFMYYPNRDLLTVFKDITLDQMKQLKLGKHGLKSIQHFVMDVTQFPNIQNEFENLADLFCNYRISSLNLSKFQQFVLIGLGLQKKSLKTLANEIYQQRIALDINSSKSELKGDKNSIIDHARDIARLFAEVLVKKAKQMSEEKDDEIPFKRARYC